jgi:nitrile hydratase
VNGVHDMGGMHGFGPVRREADEPVFHAGWERRVFALTLAMGGWRRWNIDMARFARERMPPAPYLAASYYEKWLWGLERLLVEHGFVTPAELDRPAPAGPARPAAPVAGALRAPDVPALLRNRRAARLDDPVPPRFKTGDRVVARNVHPAGHTRLPRYVRSRAGVVERDHGVFTFPDTHAAGRGRKPQHVYSVRFAARELWGANGHPNDHVYVDLWDDYLDPA